MGTEARSFGSWHLKGGRYEQRGLPVEVLPEFARYERLVIDVAKGIYKRRHAMRQRVPRGFTSSFSLRLSEVRRGSVIPVLEVAPQDSSTLFDDDDSGIFEEARLVIQRALKSIGEGDGIPGDFPVNALREFSRFGRSLQANETIEFDEGTPQAASYSQSIRRLIHEQARLDKFEIEALITGQVTALHADKGTFEFRLSRSGKVVNGHFQSDDVVSDLKQYLDRSSMAPTVAMNAVLIQSMDEEVIEIQDVLAVEPVLPSEWSERLSELQSLEPGWLGGVGLQVTRRVLREAESLLLEFLDEGIERPYIYPTEEGGVQFEWPFSAGEVNLLVLPDGSVEVLAFSKTDERDRLEKFDWRQLHEIAVSVLGGMADYAG
ncbi:hypothetical protein ABT236_26805 [Streptomyces sp. NPDC001523]|uniref:hypothetical protein n=1 Tax=Streptomyces sp. NPDC001523 TaxID=3154383 RepID=UPI00332A40AD